MNSSSLRRRLNLVRQAFSRDTSEQVLSDESASPGPENLSAQLGLVLDEMRVRWREEDEILQYLARVARIQVEAIKVDRDDIPSAQSELARLREHADYASAWEDPNPLVSVRIASYQNTEALMNVAVPSVLQQSHTNIELIIVNDGPNPATRNAIEALADPRIKYVEFPVRSAYPPDPQLRWMVAGSPGMNKGASLAVGRWIAPLDDDDEFAPDHIEKLLQVARRDRAEFAYGAIKQNRLLTRESVTIFSDPPSAGQISMQAAIYHAGLRFISYDTESWRSDEPGDWNLIRRMSDAGVRMAATTDVVTTVHMLPFHAKGSN